MGLYKPLLYWVETNTPSFRPPQQNSFFFPSGRSMTRRYNGISKLWCSMDQFLGKQVPWNLGAVAGFGLEILMEKKMNLAVWSTKPMVTGPNVYFDILFFVCIPVQKKSSGTNEDSSWMPSTKNEHRASCQWNPGTGIPSKSKAILLLLSMDKIQPTGL